jgi:hypothetical protein
MPQAALRANRPGSRALFVFAAEGEGFEPSDDVAAVNGFQDRRIQPLCHPSGPRADDRMSVAGRCDDGNVEGCEPIAGLRGGRAARDVCEAR